MFVNHFSLEHLTSEAPTLIVKVVDTIDSHIIQILREYYLSSQSHNSFAVFITYHPLARF